MNETAITSKNFETAMEISRIARLLKNLSMQADREEIKYTEPGQLVDAIYSAAEHLDRISAEMTK